jgi:hypothetical protein
MREGGLYVKNFLGQNIQAQHGGAERSIPPVLTGSATGKPCPADGELHNPDKSDCGCPMIFDGISDNPAKILGI